MAEVDLTWAHPTFAERLRKIFINIRQDGEGRLNVADMKSRFQRHGLHMLGRPERGWASLADNWKTVVKDWAMCAGVWPYCPKEDPKWTAPRPKPRPRRRNPFSRL